MKDEHAQVETRSLPALTHVLPPISTSRFCPSMSLASPRLRSLAPTLVAYVDHSHCFVLAPATLAALPSTRAIETRSLPALARFYPCSFTFYVADPSPPFPIWTCSMSLTRDLPIRSVGFPPTNAVHPPASQHGVFIPVAPFGRCNGKR